MTFRTATLADLPQLLRMHRAFFDEEGYPYAAAKFEQALREILTNEFLGRVVLIDETSGYFTLAFGFSVEFGGRDAFLDELYVVPEARGKGLGTAAIDEAERVCHANGIHALHLEVEFTNESAKRLYARRGFDEHTRQLMTKRFGDDR